MKFKSLLSVASAFVFCLTSFAQPSEPLVLDEAEALAIDAKLYAEAYDVSLDDAARRLLVMTGADDQLGSILEISDPSRLGVYFDNGATFKVGVRARASKAKYPDKLLREPRDKTGKKLSKAEREAASTKRKIEAEARREVRKAVRADARLTDVEVEAVEAIIDEIIEVPVELINSAGFSRAELEAHLASKREDLEASLGPVEFLGVDEKTGGAMLYLRAGDTTTSVRAEAILGVPVQVEILPDGLKTSAVRGGSLINRRTDDALTCMTGFVAKRISTGGLGVLTAAHCLLYDLVYVDIDGTRRNIAVVSGMSMDSASADIAFLADTTSIAEFYADTTTTPRSLTSVKSRSATTVGSFLCHLGQTSDTNSIRVQSCGEVTSTASIRGLGPPGYTGPNAGNTFVHMKGRLSSVTNKYTLLCIRGDSGGPVFANNVGYGLVQGCGGTSGTSSTLLVYTSLDAASLIGAQLVLK